MPAQHLAAPVLEGRLLVYEAATLIDAFDFYLMRARGIFDRFDALGFATGHLASREE
jgi:hypothetical protein